MCFMRARHSEQTMCRQTLDAQTMCRQTQVCLHIVGVHFWNHKSLSAVLSAHCLRFALKGIENTLAVFDHLLFARRNFQELLDHTQILTDDVRLIEETRHCEKLFTYVCISEQCIFCNVRKMWWPVQTSFLTTR